MQLGIKLDFPNELRQELVILNFFIYGGPINCVHSEESPKLYLLQGKMAGESISYLVGSPCFESDLEIISQEFTHPFLILGPDLSLPHNESKAPLVSPYHKVSAQQIRSPFLHS